MVDEVPTDQRAPDVQERQMHVRPPLVPDAQAPVTIQPRQRPLDHPAMPAEPLATLYPPARDARRDRTPAQLLPQRLRVVRLVGVQLRGALARATHRALDRLDGVHRVEHHARVMDISRRESHRERDALSVHDHMAFRARFAAIRRILPGFIAPFCAGTLDESSEARDQSMRSASPKWLSKAWWSRRQTPASCHSLSRRQQVMPEPQPISGGRYSHGKPVESTKRMPRSTSRFGMRGLPPRDFSGSGGSKGSMTAHSSSVINCFAMRKFYTAN
jgi:hypothetical protein